MVTVAASVAAVLPATALPGKLAVSVNAASMWPFRLADAASRRLHFSDDRKR
jgi:hypothetical protein